MNAGMKNGINLLMILVLFISCVQEKEDNNVLRRVEACMELFPDSALSLLSQIECPECMRGQVPGTEHAFQPGETVFITSARIRSEEHTSELQSR